MSERPGVVVATVTFHSAAELPGWFEALAALTYRPLSAVVVDSASGDGSAELARRLGATVGLPVEVIALPENRGFAGGMNVALAASEAPFVLSLNPDARPATGYVGTLVECLLVRPRAAAATGRLLRLPEPGAPPRIDACGMRLTASWRHLDRGSGEVDRGQYAQAERVFGATGAASLFRRAALADVAVDGQAFDERFHSFREDAELAFRFAERGWEVLYEPAATVHHRRFTLPERRSALPAAINFHSLKNRYLLRAYHQTARNLLLTAVPTLLRDLGALAYVLLRERSSLAAYAWLWCHRREILARRRLIRARRTRPDREVDRWFFREGLPL